MIDRVRVENLFLDCVALCIEAGVGFETEFGYLCGFGLNLCSIVAFRGPGLAGFEVLRRMKYVLGLA